MFGWLNSQDYKINVSEIFFFTPSGFGHPPLKKISKNVDFSLRDKQCDFPKLHFFGGFLEHTVIFTYKYVLCTCIPVKSREFTLKKAVKGKVLYGESAVVLRT